MNVLPEKERQMYERFATSLTEHIAFVREAGFQIGVPVAQLMAHDLSKWSPDEFDAYARHFHGGGAEDGSTNEIFQRAWLHHVHANPHHWQHWLAPEGLAVRGKSYAPVPLRMPQNYALEMVADWLGASRAYTGSWDMTDWLAKNFPHVRLHPTSRAYVIAVLTSLGYADTEGSEEWLT